MFEKTKAKVEEFQSSFEDLGTSLKTVLWIAVSALATALAALAVSLLRRSVIS